VTQDFGKQLRQQTVAVKLAKSKFGLNKRLNADQLQRTAEEFNADRHFVSATKKLLNQKDEAYQNVTSRLTLATVLWRTSTVPYPEPGIRLIRKDKVPAFVAAMDTIKQELASAAAELEAKYAQLRQEQQERLGELFNPADYPETIADKFAVDFEWPSVEPPDYLKQLHPDLWEQQAKRIEARFEEAVALAEGEEFAKLVSHLTSKLQPGPDGKCQVFRDTAVGNLKEFFSRFSELNVGSNEALEGLIKQAQDLVGGVEPGQLRKDALLRQSLSEQLGAVGKQLETMLVSKPGRAYDFDDEPAESPVEQPAESEAAA
jgi:hypothetical protein